MPLTNVYPHTSDETRLKKVELAQFVWSFSLTISACSICSLKTVENPTFAPMPEIGISWFLQKYEVRKVKVHNSIFRAANRTFKQSHWVVAKGPPPRVAHPFTQDDDETLTV